MYMQFVNQTRQRLAVSVLMIAPLLAGASCTSRSQDDLFDSTPGFADGLPNGGRSATTGGATTGGEPPGPVATGGSQTVPVPATAGEGGRGDTVEPGPEPGAGMSATGGNFGNPTGGTSAGGTPASGGTGGPTGGVVSGGAGSGQGGSSGGATSAGGMSTAGTSTGGGPSCEAHEEVCDGSDNDCDGEIDESTCPNGCRGFRGADSVYMFCDTPRATPASRKQCNSADMRLAWVETASENQFLLEAVAQLMNVDPNEFAEDDEPARVRLGANDQRDEGIWLWYDLEEGPVFWEGDQWEPGEGEAVDGLFANWAEGHPNSDVLNTDDCLLLQLQGGDDHDAGEWIDVGCSTEHPFVCEVP